MGSKFNGNFIVFSYLNTFAKNPLALNAVNQWGNICEICLNSEPVWGKLLDYRSELHLFSLHYVVRFRIVEFWRRY
jgi:hypothetical protein